MTKTAIKVFIPDNPVQIRRLNVADLSKIGKWLLSRLAERYSVSQQTLAGWVRGEANSNESLFLITDNAVALFKLRFAPMEPRPAVEEVFVFVKDDDFFEGAEMYREAKRWAKNMNATGLIVDRFTDVPTKNIADAIGLIYDARISMVKL